MTKIVKYEPYCHFTIIPVISTFYYTSISLRDKKKKKKERKKGDEKMKQKRSSAQKREKRKDLGRKK